MTRPQAGRSSVHKRRLSSPSEKATGLPTDVVPGSVATGTLRHANVRLMLICLPFLGPSTAPVDGCSRVRAFETGSGDVPQ
jgi:hypothetical protein